MSTRIEDNAWSVRLVEDEVAQQIFERLEYLEAKYPPNSLPRLSSYPVAGAIPPLFELETVPKKVGFTRGD
jgi:hypothetical protein